MDVDRPRAEVDGFHDVAHEPRLTRDGRHRAREREPCATHVPLGHNDERAVAPLGRRHLGDILPAVASVRLVAEHQREPAQVLAVHDHLVEDIPATHAALERESRAPHNVAVAFAQARGALGGDKFCDCLRGGHTRGWRHRAHRRYSGEAPLADVLVQTGEHGRDLRVGVAVEVNEPIIGVLGESVADALRRFVHPHEVVVAQ